MRLVGLITRQWRNRPGRALATAASVAVAVGAVVATWVSADASRAGYRRLLQAVEGVPTLDVVARAGGRFESESVPTLVDVPGVRAVVPLFFRPTLLRVGERRVREIAVGVDAASLVDAGLLVLEAGAPCREDDEVLLDATLAEGLGLAIGDEVLFFARRRIRRLRVSGLARPESLRWFAEGAGVVVDIETLGEMSLADGLLDRVRVVLQPDAPRPRVLDAVAHRLPDALMAEVPAGRASLAEDVLHAANLGLDFVTGLTVAMAWFIVGNAMLMNVTERRRGISLVRVLGASGRQMRGLITGEAALLGLLGAAVGAAGGLVAARPIAAGIARALQTAAPELVVRPLVVGTSMALGVVVAVAAAWWPARLATRIDLLEGLAVAPAPAAGRVSRRFVVGVLLLAAAALAGQGLVIVEVLPPRAAVPAGMSMLLVLVAATPLVLPPLVRLLGRLVPPRWRLEGSLAVEQILRQPVRTALTTGVLVVAVTNGIGLGHAIRDNVEDVLGWYGRMLNADWLLAHAGVMSAGGTAGVADSRGAEEAARRLPGVAAIEGVGVAPARVAGGSCVVVARDVPDDRPLPLEPVGATPEEVRAALARGAAVAGTVLARRAGIAPGDELTVEVFGRTARVTVAALVVDYTAGGASLHLRRDVARRLFGMEAADMILVSAAPGQAAALREPLAAIAAEHSMLLRSFGDARRVIDRMVSGIVGALWSILGLGFVVGSLGVANTVTMNVLEKRRALGLLRAVGMRRGQVVRMVLLESLLLGAAGGLVGLFGGLTTALFIQTASQPLLGHPVAVSFRPGVVATNLAAGLLVTALAAWLPARRAVRLDILEAIAAE